MSYATLAQLKTRLGIADSDDDTPLQAILDGVDELIDNYCGRTFASGSATKVYTAESISRVEIDDLTSITTLKTDDNADETFETTWASTDYVLQPRNESTKTWIGLTKNGSKAFPTHEGGVQVVGTFGYATSVPDAIIEVALLEASRMWQQVNAPSGVVASQELGQWLVMPSLHPTSRLMLAPYRKMDVRI